MSKWKAAVAAWAVVTVAGATARAVTPPPTSIDDAGVMAWLKSYITAEGWTLIAADGVAVTFGSPDGISIADGGLITARIRHEYYRPVRLGELDSQSNFQTWEVDCKGRRMRVTTMAIYEDSNLAGKSQAVSNANAAWSDVEEGSARGRTVKRICDAPTTGKRLK